MTTAEDDVDTCAFCNDKRDGKGDRHTNKTARKGMERKLRICEDNGRNLDDTTGVGQPDEIHENRGLEPSVRDLDSNRIILNTSPKCDT